MKFPYLNVFSWFRRNYIDAPVQARINEFLLEQKRKEEDRQAELQRSRSLRDRELDEADRQLKVKEEKIKQRQDALIAAEAMLDQKAAVQKEKEQDLKRAAKLSESWKPFDHSQTMQEVHENAMAMVSNTLLEALSIIKHNIQQELSSASLKEHGEEHWRMMWLAHGAGLMFAAIEKKRKACEWRKGIKAKVEKERAEEIEIQIKERDMTHIYGQAPAA